MPRLVFFNDPHFSRHAPECRLDSYPMEILKKLHEVAALARRLKADAIGCSGDWFHRKGKVTFAEACDVLAVLRGWRGQGFDVIGILGNHDIAGHSLDSLDNRAVGTMVHSEILQLLDHHPYDRTDDDGTVHVTGRSYFHGCDLDDEARLRMYGRPEGVRIPEGAVHVHVSHGTLLQSGEFFEDYTVAPDLIELLAEHDRLPDVIVCGHLHFPEGVRLYDHPRRRGSQVAVCRLGSLGRVSSDDFNRIPQALVIAVKAGRFVCKAVDVGEEVQRRPRDPGERDPEDREERIREFVRVLREEGDQWSVVDHATLLRKLTEEMGYEDDVFRVALDAVEKHQ